LLRFVAFAAGTGVRIGDAVGNSTESSIIVLALACAIVGSWTGLILIEQSTAQKGKVRVLSVTVCNVLCLASVPPPCH
jgi:hypothetical protein